MLITFEGIEGCGKTTQSDLLYQYLLQAGHSVVKTREPGGTALGEALREVLLRKDLPVFALSELLLVMAVRAQHMEEVISPALADGKIVVCDRFVDATYAYQGYGRAIDLGIIETLNRLVTKGVRPNLTVLLDCDVEMALKRKSAASQTMDRFEREDISFHKSIRKAYLKLAEEDSKRFFVVDGSLDRSEARRIIQEKVESLLRNHGI
ncbi:MAG: tmk [Deltaproteobacteria bacterium]|nr:tmk [Deltaproteobacteria bacterium]